MTLLTRKACFEAAWAAREHAARRIFAPTTVAQAIAQATSIGLLKLCLHHPEFPVTLTETTAAIELMGELSSLGYHLTWVSAAWPEFHEGRRTGRFFRYEELEIDWSGSQRSALAKAVSAI